jgi:hypothetical protein
MSPPGEFLRLQAETLAEIMGQAWPSPASWGDSGKAEATCIYDLRAGSEVSLTGYIDVLDERLQRKSSSATGDTNPGALGWFWFSNLQQPDALILILQAALHQHDHVSAGAVRAIGHFGNNDDKALLKERAKDRSPNVAAMALTGVPSQTLPPGAGRGVRVPGAPVSGGGPRGSGPLRLARQRRRLRWGEAVGCHKRGDGEVTGRSKSEGNCWRLP